MRLASRIALALLGITTLAVRTEAAPDVTVPSVQGMAAAEAKAALLHSGFEAVLVGDTGRGSTCDRQVPAAGQGAPVGSIVRVYLAVPGASVPDLLGLTSAQAKAKLAAQGFQVDFRLGNATTPSKVRENTVQRQDPAAGTALPRGAKVTLFLYGPYEDPTVAVPSLLGLPSAQAKAQLAAQGFQVDFRLGNAATPSKAKENTVQRQDPAAGTAQPRGARVTLFLYGSYEDPTVAVPDVTGMGKTKAREVLERNGFVVSLDPNETPSSSREQELTVQRQDPPANMRVLRGRAVVLHTYAPYSPPPPPDPPQQEAKSGKIDSVTAEYDVVRDDGKGLLIHVHLEADHYRGADFQVAAYFKYAGGEALKDFDQKYCTDSGKVATHVDTHSNYENSEWKDLQLFIPYSQLHMQAGKSHLAFDVQFTVNQGGEWVLLDEHKDVDFTLNTPAQVEPARRDDPTPPEERGTVPNVVGMKKADALAALSGAGVEHYRVSGGAEPPEAHAAYVTVSAQNPRAGQPIPDDSTVTISLEDAWELFNQPVDPDRPTPPETPDLVWVLTETKTVSAEEIDDWSQASGARMGTEDASVTIDQPIGDAWEAAWRYGISGFAPPTLKAGQSLEFTITGNGRLVEHPDDNTDFGGAPTGCMKSSFRMEGDGADLQFGLMHDMHDRDAKDVRLIADSPTEGSQAWIEWQVSGVTILRYVYEARRQ